MKNLPNLTSMKMANDKNQIFHCKYANVIDRMRRKANIRADGATMMVGFYFQSSAKTIPVSQQS